MRPKTRYTPIVLTAAVALASAAYAIGSASGGGQAVARGGGADEPPGFAARGFAPTELADELGVDADRLDEALRDFHERQHAKREGAFAAALAKELGISEDKVESALEALRERGEQEHAERRTEQAKRLADALGIEASKVEEAFEALRDRGPGDRGGFDGFREDLAGELGVERDALEQTRPERPDHRRGAPRAMLGELADELGVSRSELAQALRSVRPRAGERMMKDGRADLARFLAERFDLDRDKVENALGDVPGPGFGPGPLGLGHGPGGPDGPGGFGGPPGGGFGGPPPIR